MTLRPPPSSTFTVRPLSSTSSSSCLSFPLHLYLPIKVCHGLRHLPYVTGAHIRENNLWLPWIRDGARFPMIRPWYENSLQYLDRGEAADRCSPACCRQTRVSETSCREHPGGPAGQQEETKIRGNGRNIQDWKQWTGISDNNQVCEMYLISQPSFLVDCDKRLLTLINTVHIITLYRYFLTIFSEITLSVHMKTSLQWIMSLLFK